MALSPLQQVAGNAAGATAGTVAGGALSPVAESDAKASNIALADDSAFADVPKLGEKSPIENLELTRAKLDKQIMQMQEALTSRTAQTFDPMMLQVAAGFLKPTRTGSFGESLGSAAENAVAQQARNVDLNRAQLKSTMELSEAMRTQMAQRLMGQLYMTTKDENGKETQTLNPDVAKKLSEVTGDPKYVQAIITNQRQQALKQVGMNMFKPVETTDDEGKTTTKYEFNPNAVYDIMKLSDNPLEDMGKYAEMVPKLRKAGLLKGLQQDSGTPFDALILMNAGPAITERAKYLAKQYASGQIDPDEAEKQADRLITSATAHMDREAGLAFRETVASFTQQLGVAEHDRKVQADADRVSDREKERVRQAEMDEWRKRTEEDRRTDRLQAASDKRERDAQRDQDRREANAGKLTDEQKAVFRNQVQPIIKKGESAIDALTELETLKSWAQKAPSGIVGGTTASTVGALTGSDAKTALDNIESITKRLMTTVPRLPGAQSNFDAANIEKGLGDIANPRKTLEQRMQAIKLLEDSYNNIKNRAMRVEDHWNTSKTALPLSELERPSGRPAGSAPGGTPPPTAADIAATARKYNISEAEVKRKLGIQ
jgi:hypothetical protein